MAPETARWLTPDPPVKGPDPKFLEAPWALHPYQYVHQNPIGNWDPDGRRCAGISCFWLARAMGLNGSAEILPDRESLRRNEKIAETKAKSDATAVSPATWWWAGLNGEITNRTDEAEAVLGVGLGALGNSTGGGGASRGGGAARGTTKLLPAFAKTTVDDVVASAARARGETTEGARAIAKKLGHAQAQGIPSAFGGVAPTQANAEAIIRGTLSSPARTVIGTKTIDVYNAAGQGVRYEAATKRFVGFLEDVLSSR
jgi:hypothetical protein